MSRARAVDFKNKREVRELIEHLAAQGARVEWNGGQGPGSFPARVFPPDPDKGFILFHSSQSVNNATVLKRNEVRRAGLAWPGEEPSRKETEEMTETMTIEQAGEARQPGEHLVVPAGARGRRHPISASVIERFRPALAVFGDTFWTDEVLVQLNGMGIPGYAATSAMQRVQGVLDWMGYRVVEAKRNRNGFSYRWTLDAPERAGVEANVTPIKSTPEPASEATETAPEVEQTPTPEGFEVFDKHAGRTKRHLREACVDCGRHFTPDGLQHHYDSTGHGPQPEAPVYRDALEGTTADVALKPDESEPEPTPEPLQPETTTMVAHADYEAMEQLAQESEAKLNAATAELEERDADIERLNREKAALEGDASERIDQLERALRTARDMAVSEAETRAIVQGQQQQQILIVREEERVAQEAALQQAANDIIALRRASAAAMEEVDLAREERNRALEQGERWEMEATAANELLAEARAARAADDGSWLIDPAQVGGSTVENLIATSARIGVTVEVRGRRA